MEDVRRTQRVKHRLAVDLYCGHDAKLRHTHTYDIGLSGMFAVGVLCVRPGDEVRVSLGHKEAGALQLGARVSRVSLDGAGLEFVGNSPMAIELLRELLTPDWDGHDLLEGVMKIAPWYRGKDLAGWMRLTSMVSDWQRLTQPARLEFHRSMAR